LGAERKRIITRLEECFGTEDAAIASLIKALNHAKTGTDAEWYRDPAHLLDFEGFCSNNKVARLSEAYDAEFANREAAARKARNANLDTFSRYDAVQAELDRLGLPPGIYPDLFVREICPDAHGKKIDKFNQPLITRLLEWLQEKP
jgi:hypothetical protein